MSKPIDKLKFRDGSTYADRRKVLSKKCWCGHSVAAHRMDAVMNPEARKELGSYIFGECEYVDCNCDKFCEKCSECGLIGLHKMDCSKQ